MKKCEYCGQSVDNQVVFCPHCGANQFANICANCGNVFSNGVFCPKCGVKAGQEAKICPQCGNKYYSNACPQCGYSQANVVPAREPVYQVPAQPVQVNVSYNDPTLRDKTVALLLCLFLGVIGAHKFYEGKMGMGILYLLTGGLFGIGWFIDLIVLITKPAKYKP